jgi:DNA-binding transcriptional LysR family regulator
MSGVEQFIAFAQAARRGSFAEAARDLGSSPSTVAKSVARLEAGLGVKLFHRTTRRVSLTPDGERLFRRCERVLAEVEDLRAEAAGVRAAPSGTLRIDMPITYGRRIVMPLLAALVQRHPGLKLDVRLNDSYADLVREGLDVAVRAGALQDSTLVARRIDWQQIVFVASPHYLSSRGTPKRIEDLARHAAIAFRQPSSGRNRPWQVRQGRRTVELQPEPIAQVSDGEGMVAAAVAGLGVAQVPDYMCTEEFARGQLVELMAALRPPAMPISAVMPSSRLMPPRVKLLLETLETLRERQG